MHYSIISFTKNGMILADRIAKQLKGEEISLYTKCSFAGEAENMNSAQYTEQSTGGWAKEQMEQKNILIFIGACGIAVRAIAPCITDKLHDSPVLVVDEKGRYVIPILSGHMGGANEIAVRIASAIGAVPVITTATDMNGRFAVDLFAKKNGLHIANKDGIAKVSSKVLAGKEITLSVEPGHLDENAEKPEGIRKVSYPPKQKVDILVTTEEKNPETLICLKPREYVIGMGCRMGKEAGRIESLIQRSIKEAGISKEQIYALASIDRKKDEEGFLAWSRKENIPFLTFTAGQLEEVGGNFHTSEFVKDRVGVDNVCERAALKACGSGGKLVYEKHAEDGMTIAIAKREWSITFDEK